jgi:transposase
VFRFALLTIVWYSYRMADDDELTRLRAENQALRAQLDHALTQLAQVSEQLAVAQTRIAALEQPPPKLPPFVKPNKPAPQDPKRKRKKRASEHNQGRRRMTPTRSVPHALDRCPTCDYLLQGESLDYTREVIELPEPQPVEVIEHRIIKRFCPHCRVWHSPTLDLSGQVLGHGRIGVRIASLVAFLAQGLRLPIRRIQAYLRAMHQLTISTGEVVELLHAVRRALQSHVDALKTQARASPILHGDETSWRENGQNGYIWAFSTPGEDALRDSE